MPSPVPHRPLLKAYDYIVVGSGSGGAAVARRLIDGSDATVLVIEAGSAEFDAPEIADPTRWVPLGRSRHDWLYDYAPTERVAGRPIGIPRGKVLGGCSSTNAMMWYRGHPADYDAWGPPDARAGALPTACPISSVRKIGKAAKLSSVAQADRCGSRPAERCIPSRKR
ncbi:GMC family oxidoreductase N-terminal domain-containing protein [Rhizobium sp. G21]|uniref:GMC family oxidoreductase N-terminal domain-containing protein n=1 Tax=Rhizobium sp. G21 TaxID=2758439 RepID=UPI00248473F9|nr:GMC family oxidoreductase N-terminal domain-containing protein [Rhizobium sp. G21]